MKCTISREPLLKNKVLNISPYGLKSGLRGVLDGRVYFGIEYRLNQASVKDHSPLIRRKQVADKNDVILDTTKSNVRGYDQRVFCIYFDAQKKAFKLRNCDKAEVFIKLTNQTVSLCKKLK